MKSYSVPAEITQPIEIKEKGSRFISAIFPIQSADEANEILQTLRRKHYNATHVCFAWRLGDGEEKASRHSDDGEPNGTAGAPLYNTIKGIELFNILIVSVRYYGGTKLGTGGLIRAYSASAKASLEMVEIEHIILKKRCTLTTPFKQISIVTHIIEQTSESDITAKNYHAEGVILSVDVPVEIIDDFMKKVVNATASQTTVEI